MVAEERVIEGGPGDTWTKCDEVQRGEEEEEWKEVECSSS